MTGESVTQRARDAMEGVTEGPWFGHGGESIEIQRVDARPEFPWATVAWVPSGLVGSAQASATRDFIAAARSLVPELVERIEELEAGLAGWAREIETSGTCYSALILHNTLDGEAYVWTRCDLDPEHGWRDAHASYDSDGNAWVEWDDAVVTRPPSWSDLVDARPVVWPSPWTAEELRARALLSVPTEPPEVPRDVV